MAGAATREFEKALGAEVTASEWLRIAVLAAALAIILVVDMVLFANPPLALTSVVRGPLVWWLPTVVIGPFLAYELGALALLSYRRSRGRGMPVVARFANAIIETSLPTVIIWTINHYAGAEAAFGSWSALLYFVFIVASTLRLDFVLPVFTGVVAAVGYFGLANAVLPLSNTATTPFLSPYFHISKAMVMVLCGVVAGLVATQLRRKFVRAAEEASARERVTNLFGQHVSPEVVDRLLVDQPTEVGGETREICVLFLDIRNFTAQSRTRAPSEVVDFLNDNFAFMIEAVDRHRGIINKFLGDGFMAVFGAPLEDHDAARNAVAAARDILAEIDRRGLESAAWPLRIGIGLHVGPAVTGTIGSPRRKEFTAIGDTVNLASRLEQMNKEFGSRLLVSEAVMAAVGPAAAAGATPMSGVTVKGYSEPIKVWRLA
jgi:adenylate cyclase